MNCCQCNSLRIISIPGHQPKTAVVVAEDENEVRLVPKGGTQGSCTLVRLTKWSSFASPTSSIISSFTRFNLTRGFFLVGTPVSCLFKNSTVFGGKSHDGTSQSLRKKQTPKSLILIWRLVSQSSFASTASRP